MTEREQTRLDQEEQTEQEKQKEIDGTIIGDMERALTRLNELQGVDPEELSTQSIAEAVRLLKALESRAEEVRKDRIEDELKGRVDEGEAVGGLVKRSGSHTSVTDAQAAFEAVAQKGADPIEAAKPKISVLRDVLGRDAEQFIGSKDYEYFQEER